MKLSYKMIVGTFLGLLLLEGCSCRTPAYSACGSQASYAPAQYSAPVEYYAQPQPVQIQTNNCCQSVVTPGCQTCY